MLWESADPARTLRDRFGFGDTSGVRTWLTGVLDEHWSVRLWDVKRILLSDHNAIAWTHTDQGTFVVKICADASRFTRLGLIADVVTHLGEVGLPVPVPRPADEPTGRLKLSSRPWPNHASENAKPQTRRSVLQTVHMRRIGRSIARRMC